MSEGTDGGGFGGDSDGDGAAAGAGTGFDGVDGEMNGGEQNYQLVSSAPRGFLTSGIDGGLKYTAETFGHALAYGHNGVKKCAPKDTLLTARMADVVALQAAREFGRVSELAPFQTGRLWDHPSFGALALPAEGESEGRYFNLPGIARNNTTIEVLVWPHNKCQPMDEMRAIMSRLGLTRLDLRKSSQFADINKREPTILSNTPFGDAKSIVNRSNGWFHDAQGETHTWREFYQMKEGWQVNWPWSRPADQDIYACFLCVFGVTYKYELTNDYETRVALAVYSLPYVSKGKGEWTERWARIKTHRELAEQAANSFWWYLNRFPALTASIQQRDALRLEETEPVAPPEVPIHRPPMPPDPPPALESRLKPAPGPEADEHQ